ncbi:hypothetical protein CRENPOLYSF1_200047 [Crenothrix polyspora]|uniref:Uncharacterized protein n=1 Tax=Crenothrix polyspora TaxID=360316 RepID=A0A1R4H678_9GAMM|nr:hypothetical protein CRENPOLYSF1_200047 [Crenothrix polyspora]
MCGKPLEVSAFVIGNFDSMNLIFSLVQLCFEIELIGSFVRVVGLLSHELFFFDRLAISARTKMTEAST